MLGGCACGGSSTALTNHWLAPLATLKCTRCAAQLFSSDTQRSTAPAVAGSQPPAAAGGFGGGSEPLNTLDESIWETIKRDLVRIAKNLWMVVFPFKDRSAQSVALRNWDLWGPMVSKDGLQAALR